MSESFDTSGGPVAIEFGINRWVLVTVGGEDGQEQAETAEQLADYLRRRGLSGADATRVAESAWMARPEDAGEHAAPPPREGLVSATGFSVGVIVLMFIGFAVLYLFVLR